MFGDLDRFLTVLRDQTSRNLQFQGIRQFRPFLFLTVVNSVLRSLEHLILGCRESRDRFVHIVQPQLIQAFHAVIFRCQSSTMQRLCSLRVRNISDEIGVEDSHISAQDINGSFVGFILGAFLFRHLRANVLDLIGIFQYID